MLKSIIKCNIWRWHFYMTKCSSIFPPLVNSKQIQLKKNYYTLSEIRCIKWLALTISHCIDSAGMLAETVCALWLKWQNFNWKFLHQERTTEPHVGRMTRVTQLYEHHSLLNWCDFCQILLYIISVFDVEVDEKLCMIYFCVPSFLSYSIDASECMWIKFDLVALL